MRRIRGERRQLVAGAVLLLAAASGRPVQGSLEGHVRDAEGRGLTGASVEALGGGPRVETDASGRFRLLRPAIPRLLVRRIGFAPETLHVASLPDTGIRVVLRRLGRALDPVVVVGHRNLIGPLAAFYRRRASGNGRFLTEDQIARRNARRMSDLLRGIPGFRVDQRRTGMSALRVRGSVAGPAVWLDGVPMSARDVDLDGIDPRTLAAMEVYSGSATVPIEFSGATGGAGTIVLWTRQGEALPRRRRAGDATAGEELAALLERETVWPADSVEARTEPLGTTPLQPIFPDSLLSAGIGGAVEVEFVVDSTGQVRRETFGVVWSTHPAFSEAVRRAVEARRFVPARRHGRAVSQLVQLPFRFVPDRD
ncbi:MAG: TonB family protein [Gemmatimonadetes bacterium]|nr:TonB family protein [Gemmatimonadota bacterium]